MNIDKKLKEKRAEIIRIATHYGASNIRIFGSAARGESNEKSDVDFLVDMEPGRSLLDISGLYLDLRELLGLEVDIVTEKNIYWLLRRRILNEAKPL